MDRQATLVVILKVGFGHVQAQFSNKIVMGREKENLEKKVFELLCTKNRAHKKNIGQIV